MGLDERYARIYRRLIAWFVHHWGTILEIFICLILLTVGLIVGLIIVMARLAGFIGSGANPFL